MSEYGLLIDYGWCSGCQSCEIACRNEHGWPIDRHGIKVLELGPFEIGKEVNPTGIDWSYVPTPTSLCDLCEERVSGGGVPSCQLHCLAGAIQFGKAEDLVKDASTKSGRVNIVIP